MEDAQYLVQCPTCMANGAFNVRDPTVSLVMCELVRFSAEISEKKKRHQDKMEQRKREKEKVKMKSDKERKRSPIKRKEKGKTRNSSDRNLNGGSRENRKKARCGASARRSASASSKTREEIPPGSMRLQSTKSDGRVSFLADLVLVQDPSQTRGPVQLPREIVLTGWTRDDWSRASSGDPDQDMLWQRIQLRSIDGERRLPIFLRHIEERQKAAYGQFLLPDGRDGFFVVPYEQPELLFCGTEAKRDGVLFCKIIMDVNLLSPVEEIDQQSDVPGADPIEKGKTGPDEDLGKSSASSEELKQPHGVVYLEKKNSEDLCTEEAVLGPERNPSLGAIIASQCTTNAKAASAPKVSKICPKKMAEDPPSRPKDWYGWHKLSG